MRMAFFGGLYSNHIALDRAIADARQREAQQLYCLGDLGAFGPFPDRVFPLLREHHVKCVQGNYDHSIGNGLQDCQCGYTDPRDNHFARISYRYTFENTSLENREWLRQLPQELRFECDGLRVLLCHGSPRKTNEFLWESSTSTAFLNHLADRYEAELILCTHTGIHWSRRLSEDRVFANVGVLGRPENDGTPRVWYAIVSTGRDRTDDGAGGVAQVEFIPLDYDYQQLAKEMRSEGLPDEFVQTTLTGWWTTCLEVLPGKERSRGRY